MTQEQKSVFCPLQPRYSLQEERSSPDGRNIKTFDARTAPLNFNVRRFTWTFTIDDVSLPLFGADFLRAHSLLVDVKERRLVNSVSAPHLGSVPVSSNEYTKLLEDIPTITTPQFQSAAPKHWAMHHIGTTGPPLHAGASRLPPAKLLQAKEEFRKMEKIGIVHRSDSP